MAISEDIIREVRERADIVELIGRSVHLKKRGRNHIGLCPFHQEKTPSFNVSPERNAYYCFGCHASGDVFSFLQKIEGKTFPDAVRSLAEQVGVVVDENPESPEERAERLRRARMREVLAAVHQYYQDLLRAKPGLAARRYFTQRRVDPEQAKTYGLGFAGGRELRAADLAAIAELRDAELVEAGVVAESEHGLYHRFAGRVIFPIRDVQGRVLGFGGRVFDPADDGKRAKYLNSPEGGLFHKSHVLYGLYEARLAISQAKRVVVVEGYLDVLAMARAGIAQTVAPCGTALTEGQARLLKRFSSTVVLAFDGDKAGQAAWLKALPILLAEGLNVHLAVLPEGEDPDSLQQKDPQQLKAIIDGAPLALERLIDTLGEAHGQSVEGRLKAIEILRPPLLAIPEGLASDLFVARAAKVLAIEPEALQRELRRARGQVKVRPVETRQVETGTSAPAGPEKSTDPPKKTGPERIGQQERQIVRLFLEMPDLLHKPGVAELSSRVRSAAVRLFLEQALSLALAGQADFVTLSGLITHPALGQMLLELRAGEEVFAKASAEQALAETCTQLWRRETERERADLLRELTEAEGMEDPAETQIELLRQLKLLNDHLREGCPWLSPLDGGRERTDSSR